MPRARTVTVVLAWVCVLALARTGAADAAPSQGDGAADTLPLLCGSDGTVLVPRARVNDDYCDCPDGADEPLTAACAGRAELTFTCVNAGHRARTIPASFVGDGLCDCCDGSDERTIGASAQDASSRCQNTCAALAARLADVVLRTNERLIAGARVLASALPEVEGALAQARVDLAAAEAAVATGAEAESRLGIALREALAADAEAAAAAKAREEETALLRAQGEAAMVAERCAADGRTDGECGESRAEWRDSAVAPAPTDESDADVESEYVDRTWYEWLLTTRARPLLALVWELPEPGPVGELRAELERTRAALADARTTRERLSALLGRDFGPRSALYLLHERCGSLALRDYQYEVCVFSRAIQRAVGSGRETRLGTWSRYEPASKTLLFDNGDYCYSVGQRSLRVQLACGPDVRVVSVAEPSVCSYTAVLEAPAGCDEAHADPKWDAAAPLPNVVYDDNE